jgi:hypothetical protein
MESKMSKTEQNMSITEFLTENGLKMLNLADIVKPKKKKEYGPHDKAIKKIITNTTPIIDNIADIVLGFAKTTKFEVGKTYWRSNNWDGRTTREEYKVVRKTKCFVSIENHWEYKKIKRYKIRYNDEGNEYIMLGRCAGLYSYREV